MAGFVRWAGRFARKEHSAPHRAAFVQASADTGDRADVYAAFGP